MKVTQLALLSFIFRVILSQNANGTTSQACYWPDGSLAPNTYACGSDDTVNHACCPITDSCVDAGYCFGLYGYVNRHSCTDRSWDDAACPSQCFNVGKNSYINLSPCNAVQGQWCCIENSSSCCGGPTFKFSPNGITAYRNASSTQTFFQAFALAPATQTVTRKATTSTNVAKTTSSLTDASDAQIRTCQAKTYKSITIGLAVSLPLSCALIAALVWLYLGHRLSKGLKSLDKGHGEPRSSSFWLGKPELEAPKPSQRLAERSRAAELD